MGTNYYHHTVICDRCNRHEVTHIGKSTGGLRAVLGSSERGRPVEVATWVQWKDRLLETPGKIVNDYGDTIDIEDFIAQIEYGNKGATQADWLREHEYPFQSCPEVGQSLKTLSNWIDPDGFLFSPYEFS